jgi:hypothetical protein
MKELLHLYLRTKAQQQMDEIDENNSSSDINIFIGISVTCWKMWDSSVTVSILHQDVGRQRDSQYTAPRCGTAA